jgi:NAD-dependent deacetylase
VSGAVEQLTALFAGASRPVIFTGAGVSTESGIPDFRSPGGIWDRYAPIDYGDFMADPEARRETWRRGLKTYAVLVAAQPNPAHLAIARLERLGKVHRLITQNIDGLHERAGSSPELIIELHGNAHGVRCLSCQLRYERAAIHARVEAGEPEPPCEGCAGVLKPTTVSFGEPMPVGAIREAERVSRECDLFLVVGSSLVVYPAAGLPELALRAGAPLAIVNAAETHLDRSATVRIEGKAGEILPEVAQRLEAQQELGGNL